MWWFADKRILGFPRPAISDAEVDDYLVIRTMEVWTWNEFLVFQRVRMFNLVDCTCLPNGQFASCSHTLSRAYATGAKEPPKNIVPDNVYPKGYQPRSDSDVRQKLGNSQCFICDKPCTNEFNMSAHLAGAKHATQVVGTDDAWQVLIAYACCAVDSQGSHLDGGREGSASSGWCQHCQPGQGKIDYPANFTH
jgi:hypothetical protein